MARGLKNDYLQSYSFWIMEVPSSFNGLGDLYCMNPALGFQSVTLPEISAEPMNIAQANWYFDKYAITKGSVGQVSLTRGATSTDGTFFNWMMAAITGNGRFWVSGTPRRTLVLIQYFARGSTPFFFDGADLPKDVKYEPAPFELVDRVPARAWVLRGCMPIRYKPGTDFSAQDSSISIMELDLQIESMEEVALGTAPLGGAGGTGVLGTVNNALSTVENAAAKANTMITNAKNVIAGTQSYIAQATSLGLRAVNAERQIISVAENSLDLVNKTPKQAADQLAAGAQAIASSQAASTNATLKVTQDAAKTLLNRSKLG